MLTFDCKVLYWPVGKKYKLGKDFGKNAYMILTF